MPLKTNMGCVGLTDLSVHRELSHSYSLNIVSVIIQTFVKTKTLGV